MSTFNSSVGASISSQILGLEDTRRALLALPDRLAKNTIRRALYQAGNVIRDDARTRAPRRNSVSAQFSGSLAKYIVTDTRRDRDSKTTFHLNVLIKKGRGKIGSPRRYAHLVEYGTRPHTIGRGSRLGRADRPNKLEVQTGDLHPGTKPQPFLRPAFESRKFEAVRVFSETLRASLAQDVAAVAARQRRTG